MKIDSVMLKCKVVSHFQNLLGHQRQGLFSGYNKVSKRQRYYQRHKSRWNHSFWHLLFSSSKPKQVSITGLSEVLIQAREVSGGAVMDFSAACEVKNLSQGHPFSLNGSSDLYFPTRGRAFAARQLKKTTKTHLRQKHIWIKYSAKLWWDVRGMFRSLKERMMWNCWDGFGFLGDLSTKNVRQGRPFLTSDFTGHLNSLTNQSGQEWFFDQISKITPATSCQR